MDSTITNLKAHLGILDSGPIYAETLHMHGDVIIEPWNAFSSIAIALPALYWGWRLRKNLRQYWFIAICMPFLFLNGLGSTLFHATRSSNLLLLMDFLPAAIVTLMVSIYLWGKAVRKWYFVLAAILISTGMRFGVMSWTAPPLSINLGYGIGGLTFLIPLVILLVRMKGRGTGLIVATILSFGFALFFREADTWEPLVLPMGTHFLWHIATGVGGFLLGAFLYLIASESKSGDAENQVSSAEESREKGLPAVEQPLA